MVACALALAGIEVTDVHYCVLLESIFDNIAVLVSFRRLIDLVLPSLLCTTVP